MGRWPTVRRLADAALDVSGELRGGLRELSAEVRGELAETDSSEEVYTESHVFQRVCWEDAREGVLEPLVADSFQEASSAKIFGQILEKNFYEDASARGCIFLSQLDGPKHLPAERVSYQEMREQLRYVPDLVGLVPVHDGVLQAKRFLEELSIDPREPTEPLSLKMEKFVACLLHRAAID